MRKAGEFKIHGYSTRKLRFVKTKQNKKLEIIFDCIFRNNCCDPYLDKQAMLSLKPQKKAARKKHMNLRGQKTLLMKIGITISSKMAFYAEIKYGNKISFLFKAR